jgi:hypothetical protein
MGVIGIEKSRTNYIRNTGYYLSFSLVSILALARPGGRIETFNKLAIYVGGKLDSLLLAS